MVSSKLLEKYGFEEEEIELSSARKGPKVFGKTGYPSPSHSYKLVTESFTQSIEEIYYWELNWAEHNQGYPKSEMIKITDIFTASEQSAFFGIAQQRLGLQQDKVSQFLATVGKMVKELFQLVRELRVLDERLSYYKDSFTTGKGSESAEITLKGIWIDLVEQGGKNPASVCGMARELQFITLPDLFFKYHPQNPEEIEDMVEGLDFNKKVREVLKGKLRTFVEWKKHTFKELKTKRVFTLKYLRQHYDVIQMYLAWVRPYLRNIKRMNLADRTKTVDLISAFESSIVEIEFLAKKFPQKLIINHEPEINEHVYSVIIASFDFRTRPSMNYQQDYQKGPLHVGRVEMNLRGYAWTQDKIDRYVKMVEEEDWELITEIDVSIKAAMEGLGEEMRKYLREAGDRLQDIRFEEMEEIEQEKKAVKRPSALDPFISIFKGVGEIGGSFLGSKGKKQKKKVNLWAIKKEELVAKDEVKKNIWYMYKDYKKTHGMLIW